jgi:hypothetical protein
MSLLLLLQNARKEGKEADGIEGDLTEIIGENMSNNLSAMYGIVKLFKRLGKKVIKRIEKWIGDQYRARSRWKKIQSTLQTIHLLVPSYIIKIRRLQAIGNNWATRNQTLSKENLKLSADVFSLNQEVSTLNDAVGFNLSSFYELVNRLPEEVKMAFLEKIGMTMKELEQFKPEEVPDCFRKFGEPYKTNFWRGWECIFCKFAQRCDMRRANDEKIASKKQNSKPIEINLKQTTKQIINPSVIPIASPIIKKERSKSNAS